MMISMTESFGRVRDLEQALQDKYEKWLILGSKHQAINECYAIESDSNEFDFGLGVAIARMIVKPKLLLVERHQTLYVAFDSYLAAVSTIQPSPTIESRLLWLNGDFFDMALLKNGNLCIVHEIGAQVVTRDLTEIWDVPTDIVTDWTINDEQGILSLTEMDTGKVINISISTGAILPA
ncbi:hypothetical protein [Mycoavidus sp. SF9855]|uniref:hypothetical protein n=1 Tax=Mycoavidus sp. SF9855 TaxID=2968475 RepID=UPI00211C7658|nr:hypothetical protein [Mycoavidus sp. SF9855]UUM20911.1 hypothetical protein NQD60_05365 [Mycoavidus sp. SF9855]